VSVPAREGLDQRPRTAPIPIRQLSPGEHTVVIGAGPAGLTAAWQLARAGHRVTVVEADRMVGGISRTEEHRGYRFDIGGHRFYTKIAVVQAFWDEILGDEMLTVPRLSRIHYGGRFFDYPLKPWNALRGLGPVNACRILASYAWSQLRPYPVEENFEQWVSNRFGRRLYELFFKTYTEKVWGLPCTEIRAEWAMQRIQGLSLWRALRQSVPLQRRAESIKSLIHEFRYPRLGPGQMWQRCAARIEATGNRVLLSHRATALECVDDRIAAVHVDGPDGPRRLEADHVITTIALPQLVASLTPARPAAVQQAAEGLRFRDFICVALIIGDDDLFPDNWIYVHTPGVRVGRVQNFTNWSAAMVPEPGHSCLGFEYFCFEGDDLWTATDAELIALATRELGALQLASPTLVREGVVIRQPKAYPIYDRRYREHLEVIRASITQIDNLQTIGRNGLHKYNNQDHSMLTGILAVENLEGARHDLWSVNSDTEYLEEQALAASSA
jgi:protoporphyrinogen oxidase